MEYPVPLRLTVDVSPVSDMKDGNELRRIIDFVNRPIISNTNAPAFASRKFPAPERARIFPQGGYCRLQLLVCLLG